MSISANSRYAGSTIVTLDVDGTSVQVIVPAAASSMTFNYVNHVYAASETIDGLAYAYFGDATQWWQIASVNPSIMDWNNLTPGTTIKIPVF